jgi:intracellular septation protein A
LEFALRNFATPVIFYITFHVYGAKPAIAFAIATSVLQFLYHRMKRIAISPFLWVGSGFTVLFGSMDMVIASPRFYRLEPGVHNLVIGLAFLTSLILKKPLLGWFMNSLPGFLRPHPDELDARYMNVVTWIWTVYLLAKSALYFWLAFQVDLGDLIALRSIIGGGTLGLLFLGEIAYRKWIRRKRLG